MFDNLSVDELVLDTNVVLDGWLFDEPTTARLLAAVQSGAACWVTTEPMLGELAHVLTRALPERWEARRMQAQAVDFRALARVVDPPAALPAFERLACTDADDQKFIDLAIGRRCRWLLTRDRALLRLARRAAALGVQVLRPEDWPGAPHG